MSRLTPLTGADLLNSSFLEIRAKILDIAAFLDRLDRTADAPAAAGDYRMAALREGIRLLLESGDGTRTRNILLSLSDTSVEPIASAKGILPVTGAPRAAES